MPKITRTRTGALLLASILIFGSIPRLGVATEADNPLSPAALFQRVSPSVLVVEALGPDGNVIGQGSGVVVAAQGVATNCHVLEDAASIRIRRGTQTWDAIIAHVHPTHDICQLHVPNLKAPPVPIRPSRTLQTGERVYAVGAPKGLELTLSEGLISGLREYEGVQLIQTTAPISPGSSGGGLFDAYGRLVGLTTFLVKEGQNLNFAIPGEPIAALPSYPSKLEVTRKEVDISWGGVPQSLEEKAVANQIRIRGLLPAFEWIRTEYPKIANTSLQIGHSDSYKSLSKSEQATVISMCEQYEWVIDLEVALVRLLIGDPKVDELSVEQLGQSEDNLLNVKKEYGTCRILLLMGFLEREDKKKRRMDIDIAMDAMVKASAAHEKADRELRRTLQRLPYRTRQ